jgi:ferric-dicitrate binding protein FerR (iron transport regulator)
MAVPPTLLALDGQVIYTEGTVTVTADSGPQDAAPGTKVSAGNTIATGADGLAVIDLSNGTQIKLREATSVVIAAIGDNTQVSLSSGALFTHILGKLTGSFSVRADNTIAGVRGTEFFIAYGRTVDKQRDIWLCVNSGVVDVSIPASNQEVQVPAGKGINIPGGTRLTPPRGYSWTRGLNWNMDPSNGSVEDHTSMDRVYSDLLNHDYN